MLRGACLTVLALALTAPGQPSAEADRTDVEVLRVTARGTWPACTETIVRQGEWFRLEAVGTWTSGRWTGGPDGNVVSGPQGGDYPVPGSTPYGLLARVGSGRAFHVGSGWAGVAEVTGPIRFSMNDVPGITWDNRSDVRVTVVVERRR